MKVHFYFRAEEARIETMSLYLEIASTVRVAVDLKNSSLELFLYTYRYGNA